MTVGVRLVLKSGFTSVKIRVGSPQMFADHALTIDLQVSRK
jgi:hypothetical protein